MTTTIRLSDILDRDLLLQMVDSGHVRLNQLSGTTLVIANYTEKAQYERVWNSATLNARGLIFDSETEEVIARGFPKFFNWDDSGQPYPPTGPMVLSTKFDGSLGIMYWPDDNRRYPSIATRGSFASDQALHATARLAEILDEMDEEMQRWFIGDFSNPFVTYLFEIIYPTNRIVVDYKGADRLVLLDVIENATGQSNLELFDASLWSDKAEKKLIAGGFSDSLTHEIPQGEEGFVLYWPGSGFRCKMKSAEYVELHRMVTGLSKKSVWEMLGQGKMVADIKESVPDELFDWVDNAARELLTAASDVVTAAYDDFDTIKNTDPWLVSDARNRGRFAQEAQKYPATRAYLFKILDGAQPEDLWRMAWKTIKPVGDTRAWGRGEDVA